MLSIRRFTLWRKDHRLLFIKTIPIVILTLEWTDLFVSLGWLVSLQFGTKLRHSKKSSTGLSIYASVWWTPVYSTIICCHDFEYIAGITNSVLELYYIPVVNHMHCITLNMSSVVAVRPMMVIMIMIICRIPMSCSVSYDAILNEFYFLISVLKTFSMLTFLFSRCSCNPTAQAMCVRVWILHLYAMFQLFNPVLVTI